MNYYSLIISHCSSSFCYKEVRFFQIFWTFSKNFTMFQIFLQNSTNLEEKNSFKYWSKELRDPLFTFLTACDIDCPSALPMKKQKGKKRLNDSKAISLGTILCFHFNRMSFVSAMLRQYLGKPLKRSGPRNWALFILIEK